MAYPSNFSYSQTETQKDVAKKWGISVRTAGRWMERFDELTSTQVSLKPKVTITKGQPSPAQIASGIKPLGGSVEFSKPIVEEVAFPQPVVATPKKHVSPFVAYNHVISSGFVNIFATRHDGTIVAKVFTYQEPAYQEIVAKVSNGDTDFEEYFIEAVVERVRFTTENRVTISNDEITIDGITLTSSLTEEILVMVQNGRLGSADKLINFLDKLILNPDRNVFDQLYAFIKHNDIQITDDGYFVAYKKVTRNYMDIYTKTIDNSPGQVVKMARINVTNDPNQTCSAGLHACAKSYLSNFGGNDASIVTLKIHPKDVVSVPVDYDGAKIRVCEYEVMEDVSTTFGY